MLRIIRYGSAAAGALLLPLLAALLTVPQWLGPALAAMLPTGWRVAELVIAPAPPRLPTVPRLVLTTAGCPLLVLEQARVTPGWHGALPTLQALEVEALRVDPSCLPVRSDSGTATFALPDWVGTLFAGARAEVGALVVSGWLPQPHRLVIEVSGDAVEARVDGPTLRLAGRWERGAEVRLHALELGEAQFATAALTVLRPRLDLEGPARLDPATGQLAATLRLSADRLNLVAGGKLEQVVVTVRIEGTPDDLRWTAEGTAAGGVGPLEAEGTWAGGVLRGRLTLARQALTALRPLLPPTLPVDPQAGQVEVKAGVTWSPPAHGEPRVEGEVVVAQARVASTHAVADGVTVRLPFSYADGLWQLGGERAGQVSIHRVAAVVEAESISARIAGAWPWSAANPLRIDDLSLRLLGGEVTLGGLRLPQRGRPAVLRLRGIELEQVAALYGGAGMSLSGLIEADLPLHLDDPTLLVEDGVIRNATPLRLRLTDGAALEAFKGANPALAQATDWLADLQVDRLEGTVNLRRDGALVLVATLEGHNPAEGSRPVQLNYRHEENLLHLLQSLRIGSDLPRSIEERLSPKSRDGQ